MPRYFTVAEATRTLPLVKRVVEDITALYPKWRELVYQYELVAAKARPEWGESPEQIDLRRRIDEVAWSINGYLRELDQVGCVFKGFEVGLVDWYGQVDGRDVFWCWKLGEERIGHWHEVEAGFAGRRPLPVVVTN